MSVSSFLILVVGGFLTGTFGALLGLGGGVFLIPFLVLVFNLPMHQAVATSIIAVIATSSAGAAINVERGTVHIRLGMLLETMTVIGAVLGGLTANSISGAALTKIFAGILLVVAVLMVGRRTLSNGSATVVAEGKLPNAFHDAASGTTVHYSVHRLPLTMLVSVVAGNVSGLLGIGGGVFKVPAMHLISGMPIKAAAATSNFMIGVTAAASAFIYFSHGHVNPGVTASAAIGVLAGSMFGTWLAKVVHSSVLSWIFAVVLLVVSVEMFLR
jgi:uncharacterized membrane protein YfcA